MQCPLEERESRDVLLDYRAGRLEPGAEVTLGRHVDTCAACAEFVAAQEAALEALDVWPTPPVSADFEQRLYRRIEREQENCRGRLARFPAPKLALAAACGVVVMALFLQTGQPVERFQDAKADKVEIEQVESALEDLDMLRQLDQASGGEARSSQSI